MTHSDLVATAKAIVEANVYMTIATVDAQGSPWAAPVFYATADAIDFYWMSSPETRHSRALDARPEVSLLIFDSTAAPGTGDALAMTATATRLDPGDEDAVARALRI